MNIQIDLYDSEFIQIHDSLDSDSIVYDESN